MREALSIVFLLASLGACASGDDDDPTPRDAGPTRDAGTRDAGTRDAGATEDAGPTADAGTPDAGPTADAGPRDAGPTPPCDFTWCDDGPPLTSDSTAELAAFYAQRADRSTLPAHYVASVEALLEVEDLVVAQRYADANAILDAHFTTYPLYDPIWRQGARQAGANVGDPIAYYGLRMLDEIARVGAGEPATETTPIRFLVVIASCSQGTRPATPDLTTGATVAGVLDPRIEDDDYRVLRESLRLFDHYVWAITDGALDIELAVERIDECVDVSFRPGDATPTYGFSGITRAQTPLEGLTVRQRSQVDMYWVLYPSNVPEGPGFDDIPFITGGMSSFDGRPLFIIDDLWVLRNPAHLGNGTMSTVERRVYLPQWLQHEFFHFLFARWSQFDLEAQSHQWFDLSTWPNDFDGSWEPDYYAEALAKRLRGATPSLAEGLRQARPPIDLSGLTAADFVGAYERRPVQNDYHAVTVTLEDGQLWWENRAGVRWTLFWEDEVLRAGDDCPYGAQALGLQVSADGGAIEIDALVFLGEPYVSAP